MSLSDVAVLIPVLNNADGLAVTLSSIRENDHVRVLVVDDGSVPHLEIEHERYPHLSITMVRTETNLGIERALNLGLRAISEERGIRYIARVDASDRMVPGRLSRQRRLFGECDNLVLVGAWADFVDADSGDLLYSHRPPADDYDIRTGMFRNNTVIHAASMYRLAAAIDVGLYPSGFPAKEDHEFFWRLLEVGAGANLPSVELEVAVASENISVRRRRRQILTGIRIISSRFRKAPLRASGGILRNLILLAMPTEASSRIKRWRSRLRYGPTP